MRVLSVFPFPTNRVPLCQVSCYSELGVFPPFPSSIEFSPAVPRYNLLVTSPFLLFKSWTTTPRSVDRSQPAASRRRIPHSCCLPSNNCSRIGFSFLLFQFLREIPPGPCRLKASSSKGDAECFCSRLAQAALYFRDLCFSGFLTGFHPWHIFAGSSPPDHISLVPAQARYLKDASLPFVDPILFLFT